MNKVDSMDTFYTATPEGWRAWLEEHSRDAREIWLISYRRATGKPSLRYCDAVEEALCFGWIDSTRRTVDTECYAQRFSPRRPGTPYSQPNRERLARLIAAGRVLPEVLRRAGELRPELYQIPEEILVALRANPAAWKHWERFPAPYRRIRAAYVEGGLGRGEEFEKRLASLLRRTERGEQFGYGIEDFY